MAKNKHYTFYLWASYCPVVNAAVHCIVLLPLLADVTVVCCCLSECTDTLAFLAGRQAGLCGGVV